MMLPAQLQNLFFQHHARHFIATSLGSIPAQPGAEAATLTLSRYADLLRIPVRQSCSTDPVARLSPNSPSVGCSLFQLRAQESIPA